MKVYYCKICMSKGKQFTGNRIRVRKHIKEEHMVRGKRKDASGKKLPSQITFNTLAEEIE
jgi:hypothetical protein